MKRVKLENEQLLYKSMLVWKKIAYADIKQVYLRVEEARTTIGCCPAFFETPYLMVRTDAKTYQILCEKKEEVKEYLQQIRERNPQVIVGFHKEDQKQGKK